MWTIKLERVQIQLNPNDQAIKSLNTQSNGLTFKNMKRNGSRIVCHCWKAFGITCTWYSSDIIDSPAAEEKMKKRWVLISTMESLCIFYLLDDNFHLSCAYVSLKIWYLGFEFGPTTFGPDQIFKIWYLVFWECSNKFKSMKKFNATWFFILVLHSVRVTGALLGFCIVEFFGGGNVLMFFSIFESCQI